jgi:hypothetical protein
MEPYDLVDFRGGPYRANQSHAVERRFYEVSFLVCRRGRPTNSSDEPKCFDCSQSERTSILHSFRFTHVAIAMKTVRSAAGKWKYATLSIPETVAIRVHERLGNQALKAASARRNPLRVVHLRDLDARMTKQPRYIANRNVTQ